MSLWIAIALALSVFLIVVANLSVRRPGWWSLLFVATGIAAAVRCIGILLAAHGIDVHFVGWKH